MQVLFKYQLASGSALIIYMTVTAGFYGNSSAFKCTLRHKCVFIHATLNSSLRGNNTISNIDTVVILAGNLNTVRRDFCQLCLQLNDRQSDCVLWISNHFIFFIWNKAIERKRKIKEEERLSFFVLIIIPLLYRNFFNWYTVAWSIHVHTNKS